jgi:putative FmdB family regulatory protein
MPIYEYACPQCKHEFQLRLSFSESDSTALCPKCYAISQRLTSSFACKTGGNIQAAEKAFRKDATKASSNPGILITPPPVQTKLLSPPGKKGIHSRKQKK